ncbi:MAG: nucleotidyltransferase domain-containing protein [Bryobacteraceae bacterium]
MLILVDQMRIDPSGALGGFPVLLVRKVLRRLNDYLHWDADAVRQIAGIGPEQVADFIKALQKAGLAKANRGRDSGTWTTTQLARSFGAASAAKPITRQTAERVLQGFLERVDQVNSDPYYLARVSQAVLFGSYLRPELDRLGDIDIAVELRPKESDYEQVREANERRLADLEARGQRVAGGFLARETWWWREVLRFLKARSRAISFHDYAYEKELVDAVPNQVIFAALEREEERPKTPPTPVRRSGRSRDCPF